MPARSGRSPERPDVRRMEGVVGGASPLVPSQPLSPAPRARGGSRTAGERRFDDLVRTERFMLVVRAAAVVLGVVGVASYNAHPYPSGYRAAAFVVVGGLAVVEAVAALVVRRVTTLRQATALAVMTLSADVAFTALLVAVYGFDAHSAQWAIIFLPPIEGAVRFRLRGALGAWLGLTILYAGREQWAHDHFAVAFSAGSVAFRMGLVLLAAAAAGLMAEDLMRQRNLTAATLAQVEELDEMRARLVSTVAHDVRAPLTVVEGALLLIRDRRDQLDERGIEQLVDRALLQTKRVQRLSAGLLDLARLEGGHLEVRVEPVALSQAVARAILVSTADADVEMKVPASLRVLADRDRLEQVLANLLANAQRHGAPPFAVEASRRGYEVVIDVRDAGPGVDRDDAMTLFAPFHAGTRTDSVGLGLWIVGALTTAMGGSVEYVPVLPNGACFRLRFPLAG